jgi:hypothetical protein
LVYFVVVWYIFHPCLYIVPRQIWQPWPKLLSVSWQNKTNKLLLLEPPDFAQQTRVRPYSTTANRTLDLTWKTTLDRCDLLPKCILFEWHFVRNAFCTNGNLSKQHFVRQAFCPNGNLSERHFVRQAFNNQ